MAAIVVTKHDGTGSKLVCWIPMQIEDGDIICFQKSPPVNNDRQYQYPDVPSYLEYLHNRQVCNSNTVFFLGQQLNV